MQWNKIDTCFYSKCFSLESRVLKKITPIMSRAYHDGLITLTQLSTSFFINKKKAPLLYQIPFCLDKAFGGILR